MNFAKEFSQAVNCGKSGQLLEQFQKDHPTLQQGMIREMVKVIHHMAEKTYTDPRNHCSKKICKWMVDGYMAGKKQELLEAGYSEEKANDLLKNFRMDHELPFF